MSKRDLALTNQTPFTCFQSSHNQMFKCNHTMDGEQKYKVNFKAAAKRDKNLVPYINEKSEDTILPTHSFQIIPLMSIDDSHSGLGN